MGLLINCWAAMIRSCSVAFLCLFLLQSCGYSPSATELGARKQATEFVTGVFNRLPPLPEALPYLGYGTTNVRLTGNYRERSATIEAKYYSDSTGEVLCLLLLESMNNIPEFPRHTSRNRQVGCKPKYIGHPHNYQLYSFALEGVKDEQLTARRLMVFIHDYSPAKSTTNNNHRSFIELRIVTWQHNPACTKPDDKPWPCDPARWFERHEPDPD